MCLLIAVVLFSQFSRAQQQSEENAIIAIVGGQKYITKWDVVTRAIAEKYSSASELRAAWRRYAEGTEVLAPETIAEAQKNLEKEALLIMSVKSREGYVEPPGIGEILVNRELKRRWKNNREEMLASLKLAGKTVQQRGFELWDQAILREVRRGIRQSVQVSPAAIKKYYSENPSVNNKGETVDLHIIRVVREEEGVGLGKIGKMIGKVKSLEGFKKLAKEFRAADLDHKGILHKKDPVGLSKELAGEVFSLEEKEAGFTLDEEAYYLVYIEKRWEKYEIPLSEVHELIHDVLFEDRFRKKEEQKIKSILNDVHVYYPLGSKTFFPVE